MFNIQAYAYELDLYGYTHSEIIEHIDEKLGYASMLTEDHVYHMIHSEDILATVYALRPMEKIS